MLPSPSSMLLDRCFRASPPDERAAQPSNGQGVDGSPATEEAIDSESEAHIRTAFGPAPERDSQEVSAPEV